MKEIEKNLKLIEDKLIYPQIRLFSSAPDTEVEVDGRRVLMFCSNNYLGLANHPKVKEATKKAIDKYGVGSGGSRILSGNYDIHQELENELADFKGGEDAIIFPSGFGTNLGVIPAIMNLFGNSILKVFKGKGVIFSDELNHASIVDGCRSSKSKLVIYKHKDMMDLEKKLKMFKRKRKLIVTDTIFSMDGDILPLDKIVDLAQKYDAMTMVDEAHATGVMGKRGAGAVEHFNLEGRIDIVMGTLSKALGSLGGYIIGSKELVKYLRVAARSYMFSTAIPPAYAASVIAAIKIIRSNPEIRQNLWNNVRYLKEGLHESGFSTLDSETQIIPILVGDEKKAIEMSKLLFDKGVYAPCARWPAVPLGLSRIRVTVLANHTKEQIDTFVEKCKEARDEIN
ncbi:MAG: 8-amino-7-oxononanoate synthase [Patescibacteria group bacterium]